MKKLTISQIEDRDNIVFGRTIDWTTDGCGGIMHYGALRLQDLEMLIKLGYADKEETQNDAPSIGQFLKFMKKFPGMFVAHGYVVSPQREDCRVSVEGLESRGKVTAKARSAFIDLCRYADEFTHEGNRLFSWWD